MNRELADEFNRKLRLLPRQDLVLLANKFANDHRLVAVDSAWAASKLAPKLAMPGSDCRANGCNINEYDREHDTSLKVIHTIAGAWSYKGGILFFDSFANRMEFVPDVI